MIFHSLATILLSFLGFLSCSCFCGPPRDQYWCHARKGALRGLSECSAGFCKGCAAAGAAAAAEEALKPDKQPVLSLLRNV